MRQIQKARMETHCRIGKVRLKHGGAEVHPFRGTHLSEVRHAASFPVLDHANEIAAQGRLQAIAIAYIYDGGITQTGSSKSSGIWNGQVVGAAAALQEYVLKEWK